MSQPVAKSLMLAALLGMVACSAPTPVVYGNEGTVADAGNGDAGPGTGDGGPGTSDAGPGAGDAGPGPAGDGGTCSQMGPPPGINAACYSCIQNSSACVTPLSNEQSACGPLAECECNCAADGGSSCQSSCSSNLTNACETAAGGLYQCAQQGCATPCNLTTDAGTPGADGGNSSGDAGSPCAALAACCPNLPAGQDQNACQQAVTYNNATICQDALNQAGSACP